MLNLKHLTRFSLVALIAMMAVTAPMKVKAQDDVSSDEETIVPPATNNNSGTPPVIIDESDSNSVSDVEEYDG